MSVTLYTFRDDVPEVLSRAADQSVSMEVYRDGALVAPTAVGSSLVILDRAGATIATKSVTVTDSIASASILAADLPATLALGEGWRLRWTLVIAGQVYVKLREAALARFRLHPPVPESLILSGSHPDLVQALGRYASNLQGFMDAAWRFILRKLWSVGTWPDLIVSQHDLYDPLEAETIRRAARFLHRLQPNDATWEKEALDAENRFNAIWGSLSVRWDRNQDGAVDSLNREPVMTSVHANVPPVRHWPRSGKF